MSETLDQAIWTLDGAKCDLSAIEDGSALAIAKKRLAEAEKVMLEAKEVQSRGLKAANTNAPGNSDDENDYALAHPLEALLEEAIVHAAHAVSQQSRIINTILDGSALAQAQEAVEDAERNVRRASAREEVPK